MDIEVSKTSIREIIHGALFEILIYFRFYRGLEPGNPRFLGGDHTSVPRKLEAGSAKNLNSILYLEESFVY